MNFVFFEDGWKITDGGSRLTCIDERMNASRRGVHRDLSRASNMIPFV